MSDIAPDAAFDDSPRSGRNLHFTDEEMKLVMANTLESDEIGVVRTAAEENKCSASTIHRAANRQSSQSRSRRPIDRRTAPTPR